MSMKYIRDVYAVPAKRGGRVEYTGDKTAGPLRGVVVSANGARLRVRLDGGRTVLLHPTWEMHYLDPGPF